MPISLGLVMAFIGMAVAMLIGITIFSEIDNAITCPVMENNATANNCEQIKSQSWTMIGIMPIVLFFILFRLIDGGDMFGGLLSGITSKKSKKDGKYPIHVRIMLMLRLAKLQEKH